MARSSKMISYFVRYDGSAADPEEFLGRYRTQHADILREFEGIQGLVLHTPARWQDSFDITAGRSSLVAQMTFDSETALTAALQSPARMKARDDFRKFPDFEGVVTHQAMKSEKLF
jgi:uncharacterized protein (TIGR02118 family)